MRFGHFIAIILFFLTIILGFIFYWDLQDSEFSSRSLFAPMFTFFLMLVFLIFPGETLDKEIFPQQNIESQITPFRIKIVIAMFVATLYLYFWAEAYFTGDFFFTFGKQLSQLLTFIVIFFIVRWYIKR